MSDNSPAHLTKSSFDQAVKDAGSKPILIDFYADWCGPCKMAAPVIEELAKEHDDVVIAKVNVDEEPELAAKYGVMSIPTMVVIKAGQEVDRQTGFSGKQGLEKLIAAAN